MANIEVENVLGDVDNVFGANSPEALEAFTNFDKAVADCAVRQLLRCAAEGEAQRLIDAAGRLLDSIR